MVYKSQWYMHRIFVWFISLSKLSTVSNAYLLFYYGSEETEDLYEMTKSSFSIYVRSISQPMSLKDIAKTWDKCARGALTEYAQKSGGGTFSSKYGNWMNC